eukprot:11549528-Alexandrium_andersonii.AAC.1
MPVSVSALVSVSVSVSVVCVCGSCPCLCTRANAGARRAGLLGPERQDLPSMLFQAVCAPSVFMWQDPSTSIGASADRPGHSASQRFRQIQLLAF